MSNQEAKIGAALPKTEHANGLHAIAAELIAEPERVRYAVIRFDTGKIETKFRPAAAVGADGVPVRLRAGPAGTVLELRQAHAMAVERLGRKETR